MPFRFVCEHCGQTLRVSTRKVGRRETCPNCDQEIVVPTEAEGAEQIKARTLARKSEESNPYAEFVVYDHDTEMVYEVDDRDEEPLGHIDRDKVSVPRYVLYAQGALIGVVGLVAFVLGIFVGQGTRTGVSPEDRHKPVVLKGTVQYETSSKTKKPDDGAVVIVFPAEAKVKGQKVPLSYLIPAAPMPTKNSPTLAQIQELDGVYGRADSEGTFRLELSKRGEEYWILIVSKNGAALSESALADAAVKNRRNQDLATLGNVFDGGSEMAAQHGYELRKVKVNADQQVDFTIPGGS